jgi:hypothetical protein
MVVCMAIGLNILDIHPAYQTSLPITNLGIRESLGWGHRRAHVEQWRIGTCMQRGKGVEPLARAILRGRAIRK